MAKLYVMQAGYGYISRNAEYDRKERLSATVIFQGMQIMTVRMGAGYGYMPAKVKYNRKYGLFRGKRENGKKFDNFQFNCALPFY